MTFAAFALLSPYSPAAKHLTVPWLFLLSYSDYVSYNSASSFSHWKNHSQRRTPPCPYSLCPFYENHPEIINLFNNPYKRTKRTTQTFPISLWLPLRCANNPLKHLQEVEKDCRITCGIYVFSFEFTCPNVSVHIICIF